jgi:hypothetical protein
MLPWGSTSRMRRRGVRAVAAVALVSLPIASLITPVAASSGRAIGDGGVVTSTSVAGASPSVFGQVVTFTATVNGTPTPTGTVDFKDATHSTTLCSGVALVGGSASCPYSSLSVGSNTVEADYNPDAGFDSSSDSTTQVVDPADVDLTLLPPAKAATAVGETYTVKWLFSIVIPGDGVPSGNLTVGDGTDSCSVDILVGQCDLRSTTAGPKHLTAGYAGDSEFSPATSSAVNHKVGFGTSVELHSRRLTTVYGQLVPLVATVTDDPSSPQAPTGTVRFRNGSDVLCDAAPLLADGTAACNVAGGLSTGTHALTAVYSGDASHLRSVSPVYEHTVRKAPTWVDVQVRPNPVRLNHVATFIVTVRTHLPGHGTPVGQVQLTVDGHRFGGLVMLVDGRFKFVGVPINRPRTDRFRAFYTGSHNFGGSASGTQFVVVLPDRARAS